MDQAPRLKSIAGVAQALMTTVGTEQTVQILVAQFGWDLAFSALAGVDRPQACAALWLAVAELEDAN